MLFGRGGCCQRQYSHRMKQLVDGCGLPHGRRSSLGKVFLEGVGTEGPHRYSGGAECRGNSPQKLFWLLVVIAGCFALGGRWKEALLLVLSHGSCWFVADTGSLIKLGYLPSRKCHQQQDYFVVPLQRKIFKKYRKSFLYSTTTVLYSAENILVQNELQYLVLLDAVNRFR